MNGDWDAAAASFQAAADDSQDPEIEAEALLGTARARFSAGQLEEAARLFEQVVQGYPATIQAARAEFFLGQVYTQLGRYSDAAGAYLNYMAVRPGVIDGYVLNLRADALFAAGDYAGAAADFRAALQVPSLNDPIFLQMKLARSIALSGDAAAALTLYDDIYARTTNEFTKALIDLRKGEIYISLGQYEQAHAVYLDAVNNFPIAYESYSALVALVNAGVPVDELNRGLIDYHAGQYGAALAAFERYLLGTPGDPGTALYYSGLASREAGVFPSAVNYWDQLIAGYPEHRYWDDAWEQKAYTQWAFLNQYTLAIQTLVDFVSQAPNHARAGEFLFDAAGIAERDDRLQQAAELYERVALEYPGDERSPRALFLAGILHYRLEDYPNALATFQRSLGVAPNIYERSASQFWIGKTQAAMGDHQAALASWETAAAMDPTGYYSERANDLAHGREAFNPPQVYDLAIDWEAERQLADAWMRSTFAIPEDIDLRGLGELASDGFLIRGTELWRLGLYEDAREEFEQLRQNVITDPVASYRLANYLFDLGVYRSAIMAARQVLNIVGMSDAGTLSAPAYFNHIRFGAYFSELILPAAHDFGFHPLLIFSVVRQESLFESFVRSSAAANGLMQIIPATGEEINRNLGWPENYTTADLYRPVVNVRYGVYYLDKQRARFEGDMYAALAAYNGGPGNAIAWKKLAPNDQDLFLESIRFSETRDYIRRIYEIFNLYRRIYDRSG